MGCALEHIPYDLVLFLTAVVRAACAVRSMPTVNRADLKPNSVMSALQDQGGGSSRHKLASRWSNAICRCSVLISQNDLEILYPPHRLGLRLYARIPNTLHKDGAHRSSGTYRAPSNGRSEFQPNGSVQPNTIYFARLRSYA